MDNHPSNQTPITNLTPLPATLATRLAEEPPIIETNWFVLTGSAGSGKSTLLNALANAGLRTVPDSARGTLP